MEKVDLTKGKGRLVREKKTVQQVVVDSDVYAKSSLFLLFHVLMIFLGGLCWDRQTPSLICMFI